MQKGLSLIMISRQGLFIGINSLLGAAKLTEAIAEKIVEMSETGREGHGLLVEAHCLLSLALAVEEESEITQGLAMAGESGHKGFIGLLGRWKIPLLMKTISLLEKGRAPAVLADSLFFAARSWFPRPLTAPHNIK